MSTEAQISANQANAQHSTGPKTEEGKTISSLNNFRHGFTGAFNVLAWEDQEEFDTLFAGLRTEHQPSTITERLLVEKMAQSFWLSKRALLLQDHTFNQEIAACDSEKQLALYLRYQTTNDRAFHRCFNDLLKLRADKRKQEIGFESQARKTAEDLRKEAVEKRKQDMHKMNVLLAEAKFTHQQLLNMDLECSIEADSQSEKAA